MSSRRAQSPRTTPASSATISLKSFMASSGYPFWAEPEIMTVHDKMFLSGISAKKVLASSIRFVSTYPDRIAFHETESLDFIRLKISRAAPILPKGAQTV